MVKILLINPPFYRLMGSHFNGVNLGLGYIASVLKDNGHEVRIYNADYFNSKDYLNQREIFQQYTDYKLTLDNLGHPVWVEIEENIRKYTPDMIGISMFTGGYKSAKNIARIAKSVDKDIKVIVGGPHPTLDPEGTIACQDFDVVVRGEGEYTLLEIVEGKNTRDILGLTYRRGNSIVHNQDRPFIDNLDTLPHPCRDVAWADRNHLDLGYIITGRGCPFCCTYCASPKIWKRKVRLRSVDSVMRELEELKGSINSSLVYFVDDTFTLYKERIKKICSAVIENGMNIKWKCDTRADCMDEELAFLMKEAGCVCAKIGVESGSERILKEIKKRESKETIKRAVSYIKKAGISLTTYLMAGFPQETDEDLRQTLEFAEELDADYYSLSIFAPYYGTEIYTELEKQGKIKNGAWEYFYHQSGDMMVNHGLSWKLIDKFLALNERNGRGGRI